ncbi:hypothetical protein [Mycolicibacterium sp.]|uniref:hypothetical protein n=1 Tax=Mycolicibacterium sp. TaxID=2320850 RepID=UPI003560DF2C
MTKHCKRCDTTKPVMEFGRNRSRKDGLQSYCKPCGRDSTRRSYEKHKEKRRAEGRAYRALPKQPCALEGCDKQAYTRSEGSYCEMHSYRLRNHGELGGIEPLRGGSWVTYGGAHDRIRRARGLAAEYLCVDCGEQAAAEWSYRRGSPKELTAVVQMQNGTVAEATYSPDPEDYDPRCKPCHVKYDRRHNNLGANRQPAAA